MKQNRLIFAMTLASFTMPAAAVMAAPAEQAYLKASTTGVEDHFGDAARAALASGAEIEQTKLPKLENGDLGGSWLDWTIAQTFLREAKGLVEADTKSKGPNEKVISTTQEARP